MTIIITSPRPVEHEISICNQLLEAGLPILHLRKPEASREEYITFIRGIRPEYRHRIVVHDYYELVPLYGLKGIHLPASRVASQATSIKQWNYFSHISVSCHSLEEINALTFDPEYVFLSPVFDSISKPGYPSRFQLNEVNEALIKCRQRVVALGGITPKNIPACRKAGFAGVALLGFIWEQPEEALVRFLQLPPPPVMSIAGFDPSSGAGVSADIKTFENNRVCGLGVCSAITIQNQHTFADVKWVAPETIKQQAAILFQEFAPAYIKIGLIESLVVLEELLDWLHSSQPHARIIWDPILKASAGFTFHSQVDRERLKRIMEKLYLITPNTEELNILFPPEKSSDVDDSGIAGTIRRLQEVLRSTDTRVLWKGGHTPGERVTDRLITPTEVFEWSVPRSPYSKHGTGCVLSSSIASRLALGYSLPEACRRSQEYLDAFIRSSAGNLGIHRPEFARTGKLPRDPFAVQYITDHKEGVSIPEQVEAVCRGGIRWIQLRIKDCSPESYLQIGRQVKAICRRYHALFIVNDRVEAALALDADGIHLGKEDMDPLEARKLLGPGKIIGATCNTWEDVRQRHLERVDYIGLGPFTFTTTKKNLSPELGLHGYQQIIARMHEADINIPVYAIGGITEADIPPLMSTGIRGVALSSLIKNSEDIAAQAACILERVRV